MISENILIPASVSKGNNQLSVPPGFASLTAFTLRKRRVESKQETCNFSHFNGNGSATEPLQVYSSLGMDEPEFNMFLNRRPWLLSDRSTQNPGELNIKQLDMVTTSWHPGDVHITELEEVPVFRPTEEEFKDMIKYISSVYPQAKKYGICRVVPPSSWQPPCLLKDKNKWESSTFKTHAQRIHELWSHPHAKRKMSPTPEKNDEKRRKGLGMIIAAEHVEDSNTNSECEFTLETFKRYADEFKNRYFSSLRKTYDKDGLVSVKEHLEPTLESIEREYNRIIENPSEEIEVLYGADIDTRVFGSGFPNPGYPEYIESDWNLNNVPKLPGSILAFGSIENSSILTPKLCMGMCFSSVCWNVAEHHLYAMSYMHLGSPRIWYGCSGIHSLKFESALKKNSFNLQLENLESFHKQAIQIPPSMLKSEGIPVYRCVQNPGEFVFILPGSYHASFDCGFNCSEKAYFAPIDWILHGLNAAEVYHDQRRKTMISFDKLLMSVASEAVRATWSSLLMGKNSEENRRWMSFCKKDGILTKALKSRVRLEIAMRDHLCNKSKSLNMKDYFEAGTTQKSQCSICSYDLHFSAVVCSSCSPSPDDNNSKYACLRHAKQLCSCPWSARMFLFRHSIKELNILVDALEVKVSAVCKWAKEVFGLRLTRLQRD
ncbi:putative lysine-specific demethylase JMJ16 [Impatiens glandulifera]|uniref:putative lysine-specific demethylase JMJ16 n=1 Tax=Impatiens glandulifera TaxID=253017 RepID=UPI001FB0E0D2|nr:putative lysine-specific demethylase JMJ16 [Impatiens glandulifera]